MAVVAIDKKKWANARLKISCENSDCPEILEFGIDDLTINDHSTPEDYARRDGNTSTRSNAQLVHKRQLLVMLCAPAT